MKAWIGGTAAALAMAALLVQGSALAQTKPADCGQASPSTAPGAKGAAATPATTRGCG